MGRAPGSGSVGPLKITIMNSAAVLSAESTAGRKQEGSASRALPRGEIVFAHSLACWLSLSLSFEPARSDISLNAGQAVRESQQVDCILPFVYEQSKDGFVLFE